MDMMTYNKPRISTCSLVFIIDYYNNYILFIIKVAARSKAWVLGRSLSVVVGSNLAGDMDVCLLKVLCVAGQRSLRRADHPSRGDLPSLMCLSVIVKTR